MKKTFTLSVFIFMSFPLLFSQTNKYNQSHTAHREWYKRQFNINNSKADSLVSIDSIYLNGMSEIMSTTSSHTHNPGLLLTQINNLESERGNRAKSILTNIQFQKWKQIHSVKHRVYSNQKLQFTLEYNLLNPDTLKHKLKALYHISDKQASEMMAVDNKSISERGTTFADSSLSESEKLRKIIDIDNQKRTGMQAILSPSQFSQWTREQENKYRVGVKRISVKK